MRNLGPSIIFLLTMGLLGSCSSYGPGTIERDRMDYGLSLNASIQQQLLGNIVRLRYLEAPVFVNVASVINQYSLSGQVQAGAGFNNSAIAGNTGLVSAGGYTAQTRGAVRAGASRLVGGNGIPAGCQEDQRH